VRWPWQRAQAGPVEPRRLISNKALELQAAMEILAEVFGTQPKEVEEMIQRRLQERSWDDETDVWPEKSGKRLWPVTFPVRE